MDKIKVQLAVAMKHGFWIGSAMIFIASLTAWYLSTSSLMEETESESSRLESKVRRISTVRSKMSEVPNDLSHEVMRQMVKDRQDEVLKSWETLFERQEPYLTWPIEDLEEDFVEEYRGKIPIEKFVSFPAGAQELSPRLRRRYKDHIMEEPKRLAEIAGAKWTVSGNQTRSSARSDVEEDLPVVAWGSESQKKLLDDLFRWNNPNLPSRLEIYYSQESQWILKQLMMIIKEVNGNATQPYEAKIRDIETINIGASVRFGAGDITSVAGISSMGAPSNNSIGSSSMGSGAGGLTSMGGGGGGGSGSGGGATVDPAEGRYVDKNLVHISASALRSALTSNKPADASLAVAKRVPIMMGLTMDQRYVHELLAACGSADLMVDVTQVRLLGKSSRSSSGSGSGGGGGGGGAGGGLGGLGGGGSGGGGGSSSNSSSSEPDEYPFDVSVEIYGMIYLYNPPDPKQLPVEQVTKETVEEALGETPDVVEAPAAGENATVTPSVEELQLPVPAANAPDQPLPGDEPASTNRSNLPAAPIDENDRPVVDSNAAPVPGDVP